MLPVTSLGALLLLVSNVAGAEFPREAAASESQPFNLLDPRGDISIRSGCAQGGCPDHDKPFDFFTAHDMPGPRRGWIRVNHCGQCKQTDNKGSGGACWDFSPGL
ncbi:hypothetical protein ACJZ2D_001776 [Fusarium nematophilum]